MKDLKVDQFNLLILVNSENVIGKTLLLAIAQMQILIFNLNRIYGAMQIIQLVRLQFNLP